MNHCNFLKNIMIQFKNSNKSINIPHHHTLISFDSLNSYEA